MIMPGVCMALPNNYTGTILRVDLSTNTVTSVPTETYADRFIGGRGIASALYWDEVSPSISAFDPENRLIFMLGPLAGIKSGIGGSRWGIFAKSPFPERDYFCYGNLGGHFGAELKFAGFDGLVVQGRADEPSILYIEDDAVTVRPAGDLWGKSTVQTMEELGGWKTAVIGPAGERLVPLATVFADGDASCSGGMGAVMGSKNLKAVAVRGTKRNPAVADREGLLEIQREIKGFGRGNVKVWGLDFMAQGPKTKKLPCYGCMARCLRVKYTADNGDTGKYMCQSRFFYMAQAFEYYNEENDVPFLANRLCDEYGIDTWQIQLLMQWLLACRNAGLITNDACGLDLDTAGSLEFIENLVRMTAMKEGFGVELSLGAEKAARQRGAKFFDLFSRNDPYDPRYCTVNSLILPFETREPIQQLHEAGLVLSQWSSWAKGVEEAHIDSEVVRGIAERFWGGRQAGDMTTLAGKAEAARRIQNRQLAKEALGICDWMYPVIDNPAGSGGGGNVGDPGIESRVFSAVMGSTFGETDLYRIGERIFNLQRAILLREGHRPKAEDFLPDEFHSRPLETHVADPDCVVPGPEGKEVSMIGAKIDSIVFVSLLEEFYELRGWDTVTGLQTRMLLEQLHLKDIADQLDDLQLIAKRARKRSPFKRMGHALFFETQSRASLIGSPKLNGRHVSGNGSGAVADAPVLTGDVLFALMEEQRDKFSDPAISHNFNGWNKTMQYYFPDINEYWVLAFSDGNAGPPTQGTGPVQKPDIHYELSTETLRAMTRGEISGLKAYQSRQLKIKASFPDMMKLQALNKV